MKRRAAVDLTAIRAARARLDAVVRAYPELRGPRGPENIERWTHALAEEEMSNEPTKQVAFRLPESLVKRIDGYAAALSRAQPGIEFTRADAVRVLLTRALDAEGPAPSKQKARRGG
jgi:hypothetical protein